MNKTEDVLLFETVDFSSSTLWRFWLEPIEDTFFITARPTIQRFDSKESTALAKTIISRNDVQAQALINQVHITDKQCNVLRHLGFFVSRDIRVIAHKSIQYNHMIGLFYWHWYEVIVKSGREVKIHRFESTLHGQCQLHEFINALCKNPQRKTKSVS